MIYIAAVYLGDVATEQQAEHMAELLRDRGYAVEYGIGSDNEDEIPDSVWYACLDIIISEADDE